MFDVIDIPVKEQHDFLCLCVFGAPYFLHLLSHIISANAKADAS